MSTPSDPATARNVAVKRLVEAPALSEERRLFFRKSFRLLVVTFLLGPILLWRHEFGATVFVAAMVIVHAVALVIFIYRVQWRRLFGNTRGFLVRVGGLALFGYLLTVVQLDPASRFFWATLTLIWLLHVGALIFVHDLVVRPKTV